MLVAPALREELGLTLGDLLYVGDIPFLIAGTVDSEPDAIAYTLSLGPRVLMTREALARTALLGFGSRVRYRAAFSLAHDSRAALASARAALAARVPGAGTYVSVETHTEGQPALRSVVARVRHYLGLLALLSLLLGAVGCAQVVHAWLARELRSTAILRCLGLAPGQIVALYLGYVGLLALAASVFGGLLGTFAPRLVEELAPELLPPELAVTTFSFAPLLRGLCLGLSAPLLFAALPLLSIYRVAPMLVLRSDAGPLVIPRRLQGIACVLTLAGLLALVVAEGGQATLALSFFAGLLALSASLWVAAWLLRRAISLLPRERLSPLLWHGAAALNRPGAGTSVAIVALGLGTMVVLTLVQVQRITATQLRNVLPADAPTMFLLDVQREQWPAVAALARQHGAQRSEGLPVAMARLVSVDGRNVAQLLRERPGDVNERARVHWVLTREQRLSWMEKLPSDNRIVAGALWGEPSVKELSVERSFAHDLGISLGSALRFELQGVTFDFRVTSLRTVEWRSFHSNFFLIAEPGVLDAAPHFVLGALRLPAELEAALQDALAAAQPNVTVLRVRSLVDRLSSLFERVATVVSSIGVFAVVTGLLVLFSASLTEAARRAREAALLKALGVARARIVLLFALEHALRGLLGASLGALGGHALSHGFAQEVLEVTSGPRWSDTALVLLSVATLALLAGLSGSARALNVRPNLVLRTERG